MPMKVVTCGTCVVVCVFGRVGVCCTYVDPGGLVRVTKVFEGAGFCVVLGFVMGIK